MLFLNSVKLKKSDTNSDITYFCFGPSYNITVSDVFTAEEYKIIGDNTPYLLFKIIFSLST